jgi:hypothetical protein
MSDFYTKFKKSLVFLMLLAIPGVYAQVNTYFFTAASSAYTEITGGTVLATATGTTGAASLDDVVYNLPAGAIPFNFNFNGTDYTRCFVSTNGFIVFGTTAPAATGSSTGYTPLSATTLYNGAASAYGRNLNAFFFTGNPAQTGQLRYETIGTAPNRVFVIQYKNFKTFNTSATTFGPVINMQIRLLETSQIVEFVYNCSGNIAAAVGQVGLRGPSNSFPTNINNRVVASGVNNWTTSTAGTSNLSTCEISGTLLPPAGYVYRFQPVLCPSAQTLRALNITQTTAQLTWTSAVAGAVAKVEYGPAGFTPGTGTIVNNAVSPLNISGLTQNSAYTFYVQLNCGSNGLSNPAVANFSTGTVGEDCASATTITVASSLSTCSYTTISSGVSANGPNALCTDLIGSNPNDDRWVKFVAPSNGKRLVITTTGGTVSDWVMEVWSACGGSVMKCGDDDVGFMPLITLCQNEYVAGQTYYIRAWTYSNTLTGTMNLCVYEDGQCFVPPVNDECLDAIRVPVNQPFACPGNAQTFSTQFATINSATATCDGFDKRDVYFVFNTGSYSNININITPQTATTLKAQLIFECGSFEVSCWNPANGTYSFTGFNPVADYILRVWSDSSTTGTFNLCLSATCSNPTAVISGSSTICTGSTAALNVAMTGIAPYTFVYSNGTTNAQVTTSQANYTLNVTPTATSTYTLVSMTDASCAGAVSGSGFVTVVNPVNVSLAPFTPICSNSPPVILTGGTPFGGTYSGANVSNGAFNPSGGSKVITYSITYAPGCVRSASQIYSVLTAPSASLVSLGTVCNTTPAYPLTGGSPTGGVYSGPGVVNNQFDPGVAGPGNHVIFYTFTASNGCSATANNQIFVLDCGGCDIFPTADAGVDVQSCGGVAVSLTGSIGGSASSFTWINGTGNYSPSNTSATITYTPSAAEISAGFALLILETDDPDGTGPCVPGRDTVQVTIVATPTVSLASFTPVCINAGPVTLSGGSPTGGVYSGTNVSNGQFNPAGGSQTITYTVTFAPGCSGNASRLFTVNPLPVVTMVAVGTYCTTDAPFTLTQGSPSGGTYSGIGVSNNIFSPSVAGAGTRTITYTFTNANGCTNSASNSVIVNNCNVCINPAVASAGTDKTMCSATTSVSILGSFSGSATSATWSGGTGTYSPSAASMSLTYTPSTSERNAGFARLFLTTNDPDGTGPCVAVRDTMVVFINATPSLTTITGNRVICRPATGEVFSVNAQSGVSYAWTVPANYTIVSGQGTNSISVNIGTSAANGTISVTGSNTCGTSTQTAAITLRTAVPGTVGSITGTNTVCRADSFQYRVARLSTADYYVWYPPAGGTINGSSLPFTTPDTSVWVFFTSTFTGDTLKIKGGNCKGLSTNFRTYIISRRTTAPGTPGTISGPTDNLCGVTTATYSHSAVTGAKSYTWRSNIAGVLFNGQSGPFTTLTNSVVVTYPVSWGVTSGSHFVRSNNACGSSTERSITVRTPPVQPGTISGQTSVCAGATNVPYTIAAVTGATSYTWTLPTGITAVSGQGTTAITVNFNSSAATRTIRVAAVNACGAGTQRTLSVTSTICAANSAREGLTENLNVEVYPNPVKDLLNVKIESPEAGRMTLKLYDMEGSIVRVVPVPVLAGSNTISLEVTGLRSGLYLLQAEGAAESRQLRIMID